MAPPNNRMEILFVSHKYPPSTGGMEKQSYELISNMSELATVHKIVFDQKESILSFFLKLNKRILRLIKMNSKISIIHYNDGLIASLSLYHKGYEHLKRIVTVHGLDVVFPLAYYQKKIIRKFNTFDGIVAISQATANAIEARGIDSDKIKVIKNGVDHRLMEAENNTQSVFKRHKIPSNKKLIILLGRAVKRKGFSWFIENVLPGLDEEYYLLMIGPFKQKKSNSNKLISILPSKIKNLVMLFFGYPSDEEKIGDLLNDARYTSKFAHLGKIDLSDLQTILSQATAFLMPNIVIEGDMEGFGLVCLEASLSGTLVLAADIEGIKDAIIDNKNGILLSSQSVEAWQNQLSDILIKPEYYKEKAVEYQMYSKLNYGWDKMTMEYYSYFKTIQLSEKLSSTSKD